MCTRIAYIHSLLAVGLYLTHRPTTISCMHACIRCCSPFIINYSGLAHHPIQVQPSEEEEPKQVATYVCTLSLLRCAVVARCVPIARGRAGARAAACGWLTFRRLYPSTSARPAGKGSGRRRLSLTPADGRTPGSSNRCIHPPPPPIGLDHPPASVGGAWLDPMPTSILSSVFF